MSASTLFRPYRCIGYVTDAVPVSLNKLGQNNFVTVSVGKAFQVYNVSLLSTVPSSCSQYSLLTSIARSISVSSATSSVLFWLATHATDGFVLCAHLVS